MTIKFTDYEGPTGLFVATGEEILPLVSVPGMIAVAGAGMQAGIGDPQEAEELQEAIDAAIAKASGSGAAA
jgi:hypothetical protein